jgi:hypothetical protein
VPIRLPSYTNRRTRADHGARAVLSVESFRFEADRVLVSWAVWASMEAHDAASQGAEPVDRGTLAVDGDDFERLEATLRDALERAIARRLGA